MGKRLFRFSVKSGNLETGRHDDLAWQKYAGSTGIIRIPTSPVDWLP
jgi:hypothetical protein